MPKSETIRLYLSALRLDRWPRSLAILPGIAAVAMVDPGWKAAVLSLRTLLLTLLAFVLTWMISTANYIVNEITDAPFDAHHPGKKQRPLVQKRISALWLMVLWALLTAVAVGTALLLYHPRFCLSLVLLLVAGMLYNVPPVRVKDIPFLDSTLESANNPIRFLIGWYVAAEHFPPWLLLLAWWLFGNFLMVGKRVAEKTFLTAEQSSGYRLSLKKYTLRQLETFMAVNAGLFLVCFTLFALQIRLRTLLVSVPFLLLYLLYFMKKAIHDREAAEEPEKLFKNPLFAVYTLFLAAIFILAFFLG